MPHPPRFFPKPRVAFPLFPPSRPPPHRDHPTPNTPVMHPRRPPEADKARSRFPHPCTFAPSFERYGNQKFDKKQKETNNGKNLWIKHQKQWQGRLAALPPDPHGYLHQRAARQTSNSSSQHYYGRLRRPTPYYFLQFLRWLRRLTLPLALVGG